MAQLFDTTTYDHADEAPEGGRHLRGLPRLSPTDHGDPAGVDHAEINRSTRFHHPSEWQLDPDTIETGRRGIELARQALRDAAQNRNRTDDDTPPRRRAA